MLYVIAVTENPSALDAQSGKSERIVAGPDAILAANKNTAMAIFGAKNAEAILKGSPDRMELTIREGV